MTGDPGAILAVSGKAAWFDTSSQLWTTADGARWRQYPSPCPAGDVGGLGSIAAACPDARRGPCRWLYTA
jgi:hypothetical protein